MLEQWRSEHRGPIHHDHIVDFISSVPEGNPLESFKQKITHLIIVKTRAANTPSLESEVPRKTKDNSII